jgi:uncharacterized protein (TIGR02145 family)
MKTTMSKQILFLAALGCITAPVAAQTVDVTLQCGQTYAINSTVAASAVAGLTYRWLENGSTITGAAAANYTVPAKKSVGIYTYIRQAKSDGCADWQNSNAFTVEVKNKEGIDGVCLGGLMWAKYNVDEPGTFATSNALHGKIYKFGRKQAYPSMGAGTWTVTAIDERGWWTEDNDPCPEGWRMPSLLDMQNLIAETRNWRSIINVSDWYLNFASTSPQTAAPDSTIQISIRSGGHRNALGKWCCWEQWWLWCRSDHSNTSSYQLFAQSEEKAVIIARSKEEECSIRCVAK